MSDIVLYPHELLRTKVRRLSLDVIKTDLFRKKISAMFAIMYKKNGVGLAAPQVGWNASLFVGNPLGRNKHEHGAFVIVNPQVITWGDMYEDVEGCLSLPGIWAKVPRFQGVHIRSMDIDGVEREQTLDGFHARIVQHEYDHLMGKTFLDRLNEDTRNDMDDVIKHYVRNVEAYRQLKAKQAEEAKKEKEAKKDKKGK